MRPEAGGSLDEERVDVEKATAALLNAVNQSNLRAVLALWCDDGVMMPPHHPSVHGRAEIGRYFEALFRRTRLQFTFTLSRIEIAGNIALERVRVLRVGLVRRWRSGDSRCGKGLHVYRRQASGSWLLGMDIWSSDKRMTDDE